MPSCQAARVYSSLDAPENSACAESVPAAILRYSPLTERPSSSHMRRLSHEWQRLAVYQGMRRAVLIHEKLLHVLQSVAYEPVRLVAAFLLLLWRGLLLPL